MNSKSVYEDLINSVKAYSDNPVTVIYDFLPDIEKQNIRIENGIEIWHGIKVLRMKQEFDWRKHGNRKKIFGKKK